MVRIIGIFLAISLGLAGCTTLSGSASNQINPREAHSIRLNQMDLVNTIRTARGLQPVTLNSQLTAAAQTHARDMAVQLRAWNFGSDHSSPQTRAERAGFNGLVTGENVAETFLGPVEIFQIWLDDPRAKAAMLHPDATHMSLGWFQEESGKIWWVQLIAGQSSPAQLVMAESQ